MSALETTLNQLGISQADFARGTGLSRTSTNRLVKRGIWPKRNTRQAQSCAVEFLKTIGAKPTQLRAFNLHETQKKTASATVISSAEAYPVNPIKQIKEDVAMLLEFTPLTQAARDIFKLGTNPFINDINGPDDVFRSKDTARIRAAIEDVARNHSFVALTGESGSGKSTLVEAFEEKLRGRDDIIMIKPYVLAMERDDMKGKTLKSAQIVEAIAATIAPDVKLRRTVEAKFRQVHKMLIESMAAGHRHLLVIEEAHCLPIATLKHLKRFQELKDRQRRLIGILLIGQTELKMRLSSQNPEVREVTQRCEVLELPALDNNLQAYLAFKLERLGVKYEQVFDKTAADAIRARLTSVPRSGKLRDAKSMCYPLVVNNLVSQAMNEAARTGFDKVSSDIVATC